MGGLACYRQKDLKEGHPDRYLQVSGVAHGEAETWMLSQVIQIQILPDHPLPQQPNEPLTASVSSLVKTKPSFQGACDDHTK